MNRKIKFRGYTEDKGWVYGATFSPVEVDLFLTENNEEITIDPESLGQFTGCKDYEGKEIYEGDIVAVKTGYKDSPSFPERTYQLVVSYDDYTGGWQLYDANNHWIQPLQVNINHTVVIGNKYNNPDLLIPLMEKIFNKFQEIKNGKLT